MTISGAQVAALRAALAGDGDTFECLANQFAMTFEEEFGALTASAFIIAAKRHFAAGWSIGDVIKFVGTLRARDEAGRSDVLAGAAEQMLLGALCRRPMHSEFGELEEGYAQFAVLAELVGDLDEQGLDVLLNEARDQAERWMTKVNTSTPSPAASAATRTPSLPASPSATAADPSKAGTARPSTSDDSCAEAPTSTCSARWPCSTSRHHRT